MNELTKACECVPRSGMLNNFPAATLLLKQSKQSDITQHEKTISLTLIMKKVDHYTYTHNH